MRLNLKTLLEFMDMLEEKGEWLWNDTLMHAYFGESRDTLYKKLKKFTDSKLIVRVAKGLYANPRSRHRRPLMQLYDVANALRGKEFFYESFESRASELGLISQVPNRLTFATQGRSYTYRTPFGIIEFIHKSMNGNRVREMLGNGSVVWNPDKGVFEASPELVEKDLKKHRRSVDLLEENLWA